MNTYYLQHHGILGQKWGIRRFQNEDGTSTELGRRRRNSESTEEPRRLYEYMKNNISYKEFDRLMSPKEVAKTKAGSCHDQVMYELDCLKKEGIDAKAKFVMAVDDTGQGGETHSFVYFPNDSGGITWLENAWSDKQGLRDFDNEQSLINYVATEFNLKNGQTLLFSDLHDKDHSPGEDLQQFVDICLKDDNNVLEIDPRELKH